MYIVYIMFTIDYKYIMDIMESQMAKIKIIVFPKIFPITSHKSYFNPMKLSSDDR